MQHDIAQPQEMGEKELSQLQSWFACLIHKKTAMNIRRNFLWCFTHTRINAEQFRVV